MSHFQTRVRIECDAFEGELQVDDLKGREAISELFEFDVLVVVPDQEPTDPDDIITNIATLIFEVNETPDDGSGARARWTELRRVHGLVSECDDMMLGSEHQSYRLRIVPRFWLTTLVETLDIFMEMSVPAIIRKKLAALELTEGDDYEFRLDESKYFEREFVVQYKESDLAFISRLCEHYGICYYFKHNDELDVVVFADDNSAFTAISGNSTVPFQARGEEQGVYELRTKTRVVPRVFVQRDYNYRNPQNDLTAMSEMPMGTGGGIVEYGGHFKNESEGQWLADMRAQEHQCARKVLQGQSAMPQLGAGSTFHLEGHSHGDRELVVTQVIHRANQTTLMQGAGDERDYRNEFLAIDREVPYRPPRITPKPHVDGMVTGIVDGAGSGQYAEVDDQGRYRVRFLFDTAERGEAQASRCVRMMQPHSGAGYGMHFPLRPGTEVLITFIGGDPDRPIIAGTVPNPQTASPVVAENLMKNVIRTGGGNQIEIDDSEDSERIKLTTPRSNTTFQLGSPNSPEDGAILETTGASTSVAASGVSTFGAFGSAIDLMERLTDAGNLVTVASKWSPKKAVLFGNIIGIGREWVGVGLTSTKAVMDLQLKVANQRVVEAQKTASDAEAACKACRDQKIAELKAADPSRTASLDAFAATADAADAAYVDSLKKRQLHNASVSSTSTTTTDMNDAAEGAKAAEREKAYLDARADYKLKAAAVNVASAAIPELAGCYQAPGACSGVQALRDDAQTKNDEYNTLVTDQGPHKDDLAKADAALAIFDTAVPIISFIYGIYAKWRKIDSSVKLAAMWSENAKGLAGSLPHRAAAPVDYLAPSGTPLHKLGSDHSLQMTSAKDILVNSKLISLLGIGTKEVTVGDVKLVLPDPAVGRVSVVGMQEVQIGSPKLVEVSSKKHVNVSAEKVEIHGALGAQPARTSFAQMTLDASDKTIRAEAETSVTLRATKAAPPPSAPDKSATLELKHPDGLIEAVAGKKLDLSTNPPSADKKAQLVMDGSAVELAFGKDAELSLNGKEVWLHFEKNGVRASKKYAGLIGPKASVHCGDKLELSSKADCKIKAKGKVDISGSGTATMKGSKIMIG